MSGTLVLCLSVGPSPSAWHRAFPLDAVFRLGPNGLRSVPVTRRGQMALFDDILSGGNWVTGLAIGVGAVVVLPLAVPILRPLAKTAIKGGILAYRGAAGVFEGIGDLVAEAMAEEALEGAVEAVV